MSAELSWEQLFENFAASRRLSESTLRGYRRDLRFFREFCAIQDPREVTRSHLTAHYADQLSRPGVSQATAGARMRGLVVLLRWAVRQELLLIDPTYDLCISEPNRPLQPLLSAEEVALLLEAPEVRPLRFVRLRDRALLELFYGTGLRVGEVGALNVCDLDLADRSLNVRAGKGKNRLMPFGQEVARALAEYLDLRGDQAQPGETALFVTWRGVRTRVQLLTHLVHDYGVQVGIPATPHALRRAFATHMLENGANIVELKALLGHADLNSTMVYTKIYPVDLMKAHRQAHPRARRRQRSDRDL